MSKETILHISFDYPDSTKRYKTQAIKRLVDNTKEFKHIVVSVNRTNLPFTEKLEFHNGILEFHLFYLKFGLFLNFFLKLAAKKLEHYLIEYDFDIIHSHKLTFEGVIGYYLSNNLSKKHVVTIRGDTDLKLIRYKRNSRALYKNILLSSSFIFTLSPWTAGRINKILKSDFCINPLPNISNIEKFCSDREVKKSKYFITVFVFEYNNYKRKNFSRILKAFKRIQRKYSDLRLVVVGDGYQRPIIENKISRNGLIDEVLLAGLKNSNELKDKLSEAIGFVMPSYPETFGLVYLEALSSGVPILHAKDSGVDGYFPPEISVKVNHNSVQEIFHGMEDLFLNQIRYKENVKKYLKSESFKIFRTIGIVKKYTKAINELTIN